MTTSQRKISILIVGFLFIALRVARHFVVGGVPDGVAFAVAALSLFRFGYSLQHHAIASLKRFRLTPRTIYWLAAVVSFWYSTVVWVWWSRRSLTFPLFLLNSELYPTYFFDWVPVLVLVGLVLEEWAERRARVAP